jgi:hypothetical protein
VYIELNFYILFYFSFYSKGATCLTESYIDARVVDSKEMPGQIFTPNQQCQQIWGNDSYICQVNKPMKSHYTF